MQESWSSVETDPVALLHPFGFAPYRAKEVLAVQVLYRSRVHGGSGREEDRVGHTGFDSLAGKKACGMDPRGLAVLAKTSYAHADARPMRPHTLARDALAILGGLLVTWSLLVVLYTATVRVPFPGCVRGQWLVAGSCLNAWKWMLIPFSLGVVSMLSGLIAFRTPADPPEEGLKAGPGVRMLLAVSASLAFFPLVGAVTVAVLESGSGGVYQLEYQGLFFSQGWFFLVTGLAGLVLFATGFGVHMDHESRRRRYLDMTEPPPLPAVPETGDGEPLLVLDEPLPGESVWSSGSGSEE